MARVKLNDRNGVPSTRGVGLFAGQFMEQLRFLPVEENDRLHDPALKENFIERIFFFHRWRAMEAPGKTLGRLLEFHTRHKLLLMSRGPRYVTETGRLVASVKDLSPRELFFRYRTKLTDVLRAKTIVKKNTNVLQHIMGYFKKDLSADEKQELLEVTGHYHDC